MPAGAIVVRLILVAMAVAHLADPAGAQQIAIGTSVAFCLSPTDVFATVSTEEEKKQHAACVRWSVFHRAAAIVGATQFAKAKCAVGAAPANTFAHVVLNAFRKDVRLPDLATVPTTRDLSDDPGRFGLRELGDGERRIGNLIVWRGEPEGMVGVIVGDGGDPAAAPDLAKLHVLFPGATGCGVLKTRDASTLAA